MVVNSLHCMQTEYHFSVKGGAGVMVNIIYEGMTINGVPLGYSACCSVKIMTKGSTTQYVQLFYDSGSQLTICNQYCVPMTTSAPKSQKLITITSLHGQNFHLCQIHNIV